eukprot:5617430-Alexandrium_andersonii.AAC.1
MAGLSAAEDMLQDRTHPPLSERFDPFLALVDTAPTARATFWEQFADMRQGTLGAIARPPLREDRPAKITNGVGKSSDGRIVLPATA